MFRNAMDIVCLLAIQGLCMLPLVAAQTQTPTASPGDAKGAGGESIIGPDGETSPPPVWVQEPKGFRDLEFGATMDEAIRTIPGAECPVPAKRRKQPPVMSLESCTVDDLFVGEIPIHDTFSKPVLVFHFNKFKYARLPFLSKYYERMKEICITNYGPPHRIESQTVQNRFGAQYQQEKLLWRGQKATVTLVRFNGNLDNGLLEISTAEAAASSEEQESERKSRDVGQL